MPRPVVRTTSPAATQRGSPVPWVPPPTGRGFAAPGRRARCQTGPHTRSAGRLGGSWGWSPPPQSPVGVGVDLGLVQAAVEEHAPQEHGKGQENGGRRHRGLGLDQVHQAGVEGNPHRRNQQAAQQAGAQLDRAAQFTPQQGEAHRQVDHHIDRPEDHPRLGGRPESRPHRSAPGGPCRHLVADGAVVGTQYLNTGYKRRPAPPRRKERKAKSPSPTTLSPWRYRPTASARGVDHHEPGRRPKGLVAGEGERGWRKVDFAWFWRLPYFKSFLWNTASPTPVTPAVTARAQRGERVRKLSSSQPVSAGSRPSDRT